MEHGMVWFADIGPDVGPMGMVWLAGVTQSDDRTIGMVWFG